FFFLMLQQPPISTLFPYTTLFRSNDCDVGIIPNRRSIFTEINFPTRIFEYLARGKPVIAPLTTGIGDYFSKDELVVFNPRREGRSEEHTSELQSRGHLVCRLLLEK